MDKIRIVLKSGKDKPVHRFHPWIFSGAIKKIYGYPEEGDVVEVFDNKDNFLAVGHYQPGSIAVRILSFQHADIGPEFFSGRIRSAVEYRKSIGLIDNENTNVFRLINAEGDNLPGLIADFYDGVVVMQLHSVGMYRVRKEIAGIISETMGKRVIAIYDKSETTLPFKSGVAGRNEFLFRILSDTRNKMLFLCLFWRNSQIQEDGQMV